MLFPGGSPLPSDRLRPAARRRALVASATPARSLSLARISSGTSFHGDAILPREMLHVVVLAGPQAVSVACALVVGHVVLLVELRINGNVGKQLSLRHQRGNGCVRSG